MSEERRFKIAGQEFPEIYNFLEHRKDNSKAWFNWYTSEIYRHYAEKHDSGLKDLLSLLAQNPVPMDTAADKLEDIVDASESICSELCDMHFIEGFGAGVKLLLEAIAVGNAPNPNRGNQE